MSNGRERCAAVRRWCVAASLIVGAAMPASAATIAVAQGGDLQAALDAAMPGDVILLQEGAEFVGNFVLPVKPVGPVITIRTSAPDTLLPRAGQRLTPSYAALLPRIRSGNTGPALRTAPGTRGWRIEYVEFAHNADGTGDLIQIGDGSKAQNALSLVPRQIALEHVYVHGDRRLGQKRCVALNAAEVTIRDSYIAECKAVGQDSQAIGGWNGPGPYVIENNHLEGAGENFLLGGSDPAIPYLVADGITFRRNHLTRPMSWRTPILETAAGIVATSETAGALGAGTYGYRIVARGPVGQGNTGRSSASATVTATVAAAGGAVRLRWTAVPGATEYRVYGRTPGAESMYWRVTGTELVDDGRAGTVESVPTTAGTVWQVKNLFELKNARNVVVEYNVLENHWKEAQPGYAIVVTPRNSGGTCTWCVVENVRFEFNIVRNVAAGFNILGYDVPSTPSRQTNGLVVRNNLFYDVLKSLGGNAWFALIGDEPRDVLIEHNTLSTEGGTLINTYGGTSTSPRTIQGFVMRNNAARHGTYGMGGSYFPYGMGILTNYYPGHDFAANYLAGGSATRYPLGNYFTGLFEAQFADAAGGDYTLRADSVLRGRATDGLDIGADMATLLERTDGVVEGITPGSAVPPTAAFTATCTGLTCTMVDASSDADGTITAWSWTFGDGNTSVAQGPTHTFAAGGTYMLSLQVTDASGLTDTHSEAVTVTRPNAPPSADFLVACEGLICAFTDASVDVDGTIASRTWQFGDGTWASGATAQHRFAAPGAYTVSVEVVDDRGGAATTSRTVPVTRQVHLAGLTGTTTAWKNYWSASVVATVHDQFEQPVAGATVTAAWTGALVKTGSCVTTDTGQCTLASGTLSGKRIGATATVTGVTAPSSTYAVAANHAATAITLVKPQ